MTDPAKLWQIQIGNHRPAVSGLISAHGKSEKHTEINWRIPEDGLQLIIDRGFPAKVICGRSARPCRWVIVGIIVRPTRWSPHHGHFHMSPSLQRWRERLLGGCGGSRRSSTSPRVEHANASSISSSALPPKSVTGF